MAKFKKGDVVRERYRVLEAIPRHDHPQREQWYRCERLDCDDDLEDRVMLEESLLQPDGPRTLPPNLRNFIEACRTKQGFHRVTVADAPYPTESPCMVLNTYTADRLVAEADQHFPVDGSSPEQNVQAAIYSHLQDTINQQAQVISDLREEIAGLEYLRNELADVVHAEKRASWRMYAAAALAHGATESQADDIAIHMLKRELDRFGDPK